MTRLAALAVLAAALCACQTTQELSAQRAKTAKKLVNQKGLTVSRENPNVAVGATAVLQDKNGIAAVVELRNTGREAQAGLPVSIAVTDAAGKALYRNDVAGLEDSLVTMPLLTKGEDAFWVNNQISATATTRSGAQRLTRTRPPRSRACAGRAARRRPARSARTRRGRRGT